jgi:hypothetical protein
MISRCWGSKRATIFRKRDHEAETQFRAPAGDI